ncbi:MAG: SDR family NAD(P)-dependent oxidoreductase, partial [Bacteroidota bacterium]
MAREKWTPELVGDQTGRVMIVTGATSGIGKETARVLVGKNAHVILAVRNQDKGQAALTEFLLEYPKAEVEVRTLDLSNLSSIEAFAEGMARDFDRLDVLVNNAGVMMCPYGKTADGFEMQIGTNHMGHFALTGQLMPLLKATPDSRVVNVSSVGHRTGKIDLNDLNWEARKY